MMTKNTFTKGVSLSSNAMILCAACSLCSLSLVGCSSSSTRTDKGSSIEEINPAIGYVQRRKQEALQHYSIASQFHLDEMHEEALAEYRKALELDDKLYAAWNNMGQLLMAQGNYADAVSAYQIASGIEPTDPRPEYNIGLAYQQVGWAEDSFTHFENALARDANYIPALRGVVRSAEMLGTGDSKILGYIKNAQLRETDEQWREYFSTQKFRVEAYIRSH
ncbi:MAG: tetratricopeptide repeat protein [Phycisphaerales bacterium]|jgi:tetratricopeptide (TPR) repeat protein|nr:tetratricopeptide repeat protein [Phycisphaerales bacterium]